ncbi:MULTISPECIES: 16S rRNA (uracil(1498)-N(3))-methyltransferase [Sphingobacterium]|jgi:16S rRNA (uracil1498-N3)-methyltransferase|uniref:Ribosomal RNA small subunit methyltransferase E n=1 Tax=Sphingobacterium multivorum TaxID=28454 RepID=A0A654CWI7_SPHMU|nr:MULTISPECIES: 16S rRNA (uracil(1498)-N(3))-methyltransferase [Sphingobacterium]HAK27642.1 16S rRNA (uracil(1498)-N(3))-methyltransferase [Sphingobacterium sp.]QQT44777.1 16S rRNA (uracil(1498)-N(3))-methyltransferase [Sphingobacterium multivorum]QQT62495.1 16S rRNA (uracil(1498)-N(3))-methyltransferase [Sphingobacterium multivorum]SUJ16528.1 Ribosomal RNA small subunit methyltransferase E [Sphingobacterium multivorum]VXC97401.1 Ribosomal RNA small subunit methyltransferase E [Sphingobacteri
MQLFFTPDLNPSLENFILSEEESKHAIRVLRMNTGDHLHLIDGRGGLYEAQIIDPHPKRTVLTILNVKEYFQQPRYHLHIAVAPTKNIDRIEWFLEKATEVGIQEITPVICEHSERKEVKLDRLNKVVVAAMKQSLKAYLPKLNPAVSFKQFLRDIPTEGVQKAIAHCVDAEKKYLNQVLEPSQHYIILIGPEGDFSEEEIDLALQMGFHPISLGEARLRTETAALAACMEVSLLNR